MAKRVIATPSVAEEEVDETEVPTETHLYRVTFRRAGSLSSKSRTYVTFGMSEDDARDRIWNAYAGSNFSRDFDRDGASVEFILGGILKIGGN